MAARGTGAPRLSVCIVTWNCRDLVLNCLRTLSEGRNEVSYEVLLVDNASRDGTVQAVRELHPEVTVVSNEANVGFAAANNQAIRLARGEYIFLLNPDTVLPERALDDLVRVADEHPRAGAVGPKLLNPDGTLQYSCRRFPKPWAALFRNTLFGRLFPHERWTREYLMADWDHNELREVDWVSGAALLLRREAVEQVGLLDERYFWGSEDVDYCRRLEKAGWQVLYTPTPAIVHIIGGSTDRAVLQTIQRRHASWYRLYSRHFSHCVLDRAVLWLLIWMRGTLLLASWVIQDLWAKVKAAWLRALRRHR
ncbi:MAG: glycosyltransferase family 2 protein [Armatimonadota bacterium]